MLKIDKEVQKIINESFQKNEAETIKIGSGSNGDYYDYNGTRYVRGHYVTQYLVPKLKGKKLNFIKGINSFKSDRINKVPISDDFFNRMKDDLLKELNKTESFQKNEKEDISKYRVYSYDIKDGWSILGHYDDEYSAERVYDAWKLRLKRNNGKYGVYRDVKLLEPGQKNESFQKNEEGDIIAKINKLIDNVNKTILDTIKNKKEAELYTLKQYKNKDGQTVLKLYRGDREFMTSKLAAGDTLLGDDIIGHLNALKSRKYESIKESAQKNEDFNTYSVAWREFDRQDRVISKQKDFKTAGARDSFIKKIKEHPRFYEIIATADPENESSQKNEEALSEEGILRLFDQVRGYVESVMKILKLDASVSNYEKLSSVFYHLRNAADSWQEYKDGKTTMRDAALQWLLHSCYENLKKAKDTFN